MAGRGALVERHSLFSRRVRYDYLFEMETWLKALADFFDVENLPLAPEERERLAIRNYVDEVGVAREAIAHVGRVAEKLLGEDREDFATFIQYVEKQIGGEVTGTGRTAERLESAEIEMAAAVEAINDFIRVFDELSRARYIGHASFVSAGRLLVRMLRRDSNLGIFFRDDLLPTLETTDRRALSRILARLEDRDARRQLATLFAGLFKGLHYIEEAAALTPKPAGRRRALLLFSRVSALTISLSEYIRGKLLEGEPASSPRGEALDRLLFSTEMELRKVMEGELVDVAHLKDSRTAQERLENACGILRDLFQQNILALAEAYAGPVDSRRIFPDHVTRREQSLRLRQDLWDLVVSCRRFQESSDRRSFDRFIEDLQNFRRSSMRFLMFKDWSAFDRFARGFARERSLRTFLSAAHQFEIFAKTLIREIGKRQVLAGRGFEPDREARVQESPAI